MAPAWGEAAHRSGISARLLRVMSGTVGIGRGRCQSPDVLLCAGIVRIGGVRSGPLPYLPTDRWCVAATPDTHGAPANPSPDTEVRITTAERPTGIVTFLLTDIEGSTRLLQQLGSGYAALLAQHHRLMRAAVAGQGGVEVKTEGDSFFVVFPAPRDGVAAAVEAQRAIAAADWPGSTALGVRMGLHEGEIELTEGEYVGMELHRAARIAAAAHGGQVVISARIRDAVAGQLPEGVALQDLGEHRLRDIDESVHLYQLDIAGLRTDFPPLASVSARFDVLPPELSTFVGRDAEVDRISDLLGDSRLLTMTGPGGTGKSRLALRVARHCSASYPQGVAFVPLAPIDDPALVAPTIRSTLGFAEEPGKRPLDTLVEQLKAQQLLLILDNFEQIMPAAESVSALLEGTDNLTVMVTSRAALHLDGEQEFAVPPLMVPELGRTVDLDELSSNESVSLFVDRARQARPDFRLDERNARSVALICQRLEGLPLAIELAASRIKLLSPDALLARLSRRLELLDSGAGRPDRRRTLRGTIDWSHDLLGPAERAAFRRLSVFSGGATLDSIEAIVPTVAAAGAGGDVLGDVLEPLAALVDHSLVRYEDRDGAARYMMLETIREYGLERLTDAGEREALEEAHATWFLARVAELSGSFTSGPDGLDEVEADHDNVRAAVRWMIAQGRTGEAQEAVAALWRFWQLRGHLREGLVVSSDVMALPDADEPTEATAGALYARASLLYWQGESEKALDLYLRSLEVARAAGATAREAEAQFALAYTYMITKQWAEAKVASDAAATLYQQVGDELGVVNSRFAEAYARALAGEYERAVEVFRGVIVDVEATGDRFWLMSSRVTLAWTLTRLGELDEARQMLLANLEGSIELGDGSMENMAIEGLATIAALEGDSERALRLAGAAARIADEMGGKAPGELVIALDPVELARDAGVSEEDISSLTAEGRALEPEVARSLARDPTS